MNLALEDGLAGRVRVRQHRGIHMDDHLVPLSRGAGIDAVVEGRLGEQREGVSLLLGHGGRFRGNVGRAPLLIERLASRSQRLHEQSPDFGRQPATQHHHAVIVLIDV
jgi:hypothetical protein